jgi:hypothetical protein
MYVKIPTRLTNWSTETVLVFQSAISSLLQSAGIISVMLISDADQ